ncbi:hypothetical protein GGQ85_003970 [Nitrobacter vulgaris]|nr:hypothetical protein [Nitrobacter vulgaris]
MAIASPLALGAPAEWWLSAALDHPKALPPLHKIPNMSRFHLEYLTTSLNSFLFVAAFF